jgi:hypothetical protein
MQVGGQLHAPSTLPPAKDPLVLIGQNAEWVPWDHNERGPSSEYRST